MNRHQRKSPLASIRAASRSMSAASESCSEASESLRAASESLRSASRSVDDATETFRTAAAMGAAWSLRAGWAMGAAAARPKLEVGAGQPPIDGQLRSRAGKRGQPPGGPRRRRRGDEHKRRGIASRLIRVASWSLIALGLIALVDAGVTMVWQEPVTALYALIQQDELSGSLERLDRATPTAAVAGKLSLLHDETARVALLAGELERSAAQGSAVGRLVIPHIGANYAVVKGTNTAALEEGPGIYGRGEYRRSMFPGLAGVTAIAGHRTTFLAPFRHIDALRAGDQISLTMPYARFIYAVQRTRIVSPNNVRAALDPPGGNTRLVLSSCNPPFSAAQRILVYAGLTRVVPLGPARSYLRGILTRSYPSSRLEGELGLPNTGLTANI